ncbi:MAG: acyl-CoA thioesterase [Deltaproteobacteria bacterium]|nr:acyl-CoA thioesterase [Deltaproteobacteria bacterium]
MNRARKPEPFGEVKHWHRVAMRIPFRDVDSWGLVWHGHYFSYVDQTRLDLLKRFDIHFGQFARHGFVMPVVNVNMDLKAPGRADEAIAVDAAMLRVRGAMIDTHFRIVRAVGEQTVLARGTTRQVFTRLDGGLLYHVPESVAAGFEAMTAYALGTAARPE